MRFRDWYQDSSPTKPLEPKRMPFAHPLWVLFSSGTTGRPKGIVHSTGGALLEHLKAMRLNLDLGPSDTFFWYTTTSWMVWRRRPASPSSEPAPPSSAQREPTASFHDPTST